MDIEGMQNARLGTIYLWQGIKPKSALADAVMSGVMTSVSGILGTQDINVAESNIAVSAASTLAEASGEGGAGLFGKIKAWAEDLVKKLWGKIKDVFGDVGDVLGTLKNLALFITQQVFKNAAPIIGGVVGLVQGLWKTTVGIVEKVGSWMAAKGVKIAFGQPKTLVDGIERALTRSLLEGIYETVKSTVSLTLNGLSLGASSIVDCVVGVVESAVKIIWRIAEIKVLNKFIQGAKEMWQTRGSSSSGHLDSDKFNDWLRPATQKVPVIAAVTLGSGIAGDKMRLLQMYTGSGNVISQSSFDAGVNYLDQLKRLGSRVIERSDLSFNSDDKMIAGLLQLAEKVDAVQSNKSFWKRLFRTADKVARA